MVAAAAAAVVVAARCLNHVATARRGAPAPLALGERSGGEALGGSGDHRGLAVRRAARRKRWRFQGPRGGRGDEEQRHRPMRLGKCPAVLRIQML